MLQESRPLEIIRVPFLFSETQVSSMSERVTISFCPAKIHSSISVIIPNGEHVTDILSEAGRQVRESLWRSQQSGHSQVFEV